MNYGMNLRAKVNGLSELWPVVDSKLIVLDKVTIVIQVNGKLKGSLRLLLTF